MQVAAMPEEIRRAIFFFGRWSKDHVETDVAGVVFPVVPGARIERLAPEHRLQAPLAQHLHRGAADLEAGAQPRELRGLFVDRYVQSRARQSRGGRKTAHPCPND